MKNQWTGPHRIWSYMVIRSVASRTLLCHECLENLRKPRVIIADPSWADSHCHDGLWRASNSPPRPPPCITENHWCSLVSSSKWSFRNQLCGTCFSSADETVDGMNVLWVIPALLHVSLKNYRSRFSIFLFFFAFWAMLYLKNSLWDKIYHLYQEYHEKSHDSQKIFR